MGKVFFIFGIHNHQPVGNFEHVFKYAYDRTYYPFIKTIEKFPKIKFCLHNSGPLYDWIMRNEPEYLAIIRKMVARGQVEIISGGYYEPILPLIPDNDKDSQIIKMNAFIKKQFDSTPLGLWLAERVWEQSLAEVINNNNLKYTFLDDTHFRFAGYSENEFFNYYITEDAGRAIKIFPISKTLRYKIPFAEAFESVDLLKSFKRQNEDVLVTLFDDGEKFGLWPNTYDWVYKNKWLEKFFEMLSNSDDEIETILPRVANDMFKSEGIIYFGSSSYQEMTEWVLEPKVFNEYSDTKKFLNENGRAYQSENFVKGGVFRNFYRKYNRLNYMHKRMMDLSYTLADVADTRKDSDIFDFCYKAQTNCGYWHGVFGGFYLAHIRAAVYENLMKAENLLDERYKTINCTEIKDLDFDSLEEVIVKNKKMRVCLSRQGGTIVELSLRQPAMNLVNTVTRQEETYHSKITDKKCDNTDHSSIHDIVVQKEEGLSEYLIYDKYERVCAVDHFLRKDLTLDMFNRQTGIFPLSKYVYDFEVTNSKKKTEIIYELKNSFTKKITIDELSGIKIEYFFKNLEVFNRENFGLEFNLSFLSLKDVYGVCGGKRKSLQKPSSFNGIKGFRIEDNHSGVSCEFSFSGGDLLVVPVYTVSSSESGFEKTYQQTSLMFIKTDKTDNFSLDMRMLKM